MNNNENVVELIDDEGVSTLFEYLMTLTYREQDYVILGLLEDEDYGYEEDDGDEDELEIIILRVEVDEDGNDLYVGIEDMDELNEIFMAYDEIVNSDIYE